MANQDSPLWETEYGLCLNPPWTSFNMTMALNLRLLIIPPKHSTIKGGKALLMVNNKVTYQSKSWIHNTPTGMQAVLIPTPSDDSHPGPAIIEEHELYFKACIISLMFMWDPEDCITWDVS